MGTLCGTFIKNPKNTRFDGEDDDEEILYIFRRSLITNLDWIGIAAIMLITPAIVRGVLAMNGLILSRGFIFTLSLFWYLTIAGFVFQNLMIWYYNVYIITNKKIVDVDFHGILFKNISEAPLKNIEDVTSNISGALEVIFNYGSVFIQTSAEKREFEFENIPNPSKVRDIISDMVTQLRGGHH
ncbi:MAG: PH domain-containing protein [Patescibacteria group bacterium]|jgi:hypothetical protein